MSAKRRGSAPLWFRLVVAALLLVAVVLAWLTGDTQTVAPTLLHAVRLVLLP